MQGLGPYTPNPHFGKKSEGACNYILNPSFEEAADDFGLPLAHEETAHARCVCVRERERESKREGGR